MNTKVFALTSSLALSVCVATSAAEPEEGQEADSVSESGERTAKNGLYLELLGPGIFYSFNYERAFSDDVSARIGFSYIRVDATSESNSTKGSLLSVPITVSYLGIGSLKHILELGAGGFFVHASAAIDVAGKETEGSETTAGGVVIVGYRYQPADGGFMFRGGISPIFGSGGVGPWPHLSVGGAF